jgi:hypothetical protein
MALIFIIAISFIIGLTTYCILHVNSIVVNSELETYLDANLNAENSVPVPCMEPHCEIECMTLYPNHKLTGKIKTHILSEEEKQHLAIDSGADKLVNDMINDYPLPKVCPYRTSGVIFEENSKNIHVKYFPLSFGFNERYLFKTIPTKVLFDGHTRYINQTCIPKKSKDFSDLIPGRRETYRFNFGEELEYRRIYSSVYFAVTMKKGGWDCNRHYEILSSGTVPYFDNLEHAGSFMMKHLPKTLLLEARSLVGVNRENLTIDHDRFNLTQYRLLLHRILYYTKHRLTTRKLVEYMLKNIQYPMSQNHSVLFISHKIPDYMKEYMLHGFTLIFGSSLHVYDPPNYLYTYPSDKQWTAENAKKYYIEDLSLAGFGFGYALSLRKYSQLYKRDKKELSIDTIVKNIEVNHYTLIVFGSIFRRNYLFPLVTRHYHKSRIIVIDGEDERKHTERSEYARLTSYFLREIPDNCDDFS